MKDVRSTLAQAWTELNKIAKKYDLTQKLNQDQISELLIDLDDLEGIIGIAKSETAGYSEDVSYAIATEQGAEEFTAFTHGPSPDIESMLSLSPDDGQILVRISMKNGEPDYKPLKGFLDGEWIDC